MKIAAAARIALELILLVAGMREAAPMLALVAAQHAGAPNVRAARRGR